MSVSHHPSMYQFVLLLGLLTAATATATDTAAATVAATAAAAAFIHPPPPKKKGPRNPAQPIPDRDKLSGSSRDVGLTSFYYSLVSVHLFRDAAPRSHPLQPLTLAARPPLAVYYYTAGTPYEYSMTLAAPGFVTTGVQTSSQSASRQDASCPKRGACHIIRQETCDACSAVQCSAVQPQCHCVSVRCSASCSALRAARLA